MCKLSDSQEEARDESVVEPMVAVAFAAESMGGAEILAVSDGARSERAEVLQQGPATQTQFVYRQE